MVGQTKKPIGKTEPQFLSDPANNPYLMVRSHSEYYTSMSVSGLPTFLISVKNMNLLSSSIYKHLKIYLIKHKQSLILGDIYNITKKMVGQTKKPIGKTEPQFLSDPMSDRKKKVFANSIIPNVWYLPQILSERH
jgi:hypothetical protein